MLSITAEGYHSLREEGSVSILLRYNCSWPLNTAGIQIFNRQFAKAKTEKDNSARSFSPYTIIRPEVPDGRSRDNKRDQMKSTAARQRP